MRVLAGLGARAAFTGCDVSSGMLDEVEVGQAHVGAARPLLDLLVQEIEARDLLGAAAQCRHNAAGDAKQRAENKSDPAANPGHPQGRGKSHRRGAKEHGGDRDRSKLRPRRNLPASQGTDRHDKDGCRLKQRLRGRKKEHLPMLRLVVGTSSSVHGLLGLVL